MERESMIIGECTPTPKKKQKKVCWGDAHQPHMLKRSASTQLREKISFV